MNRILNAAVLFAAATTVVIAPADEPRAQGTKVDESNRPITAALDGKFMIQEPVPLNGPFPALLRTAKVGDRLLLQVAYAPAGSVIPKTIIAKAENPSMAVIDVLPSEHLLALLKAKEKAEGQPGNYFAVLVRAAAAGDCGVVLTCQMSDGTEKKVPFQFKIEK